jgi:methylase of polypeptide subunit release factors
MTGLVLDESGVSSKLGRVNWDFADYLSSSYPEDINNIHWYPAAFIPQIPSILIQTLALDSDVILDPFAGSGVTLIEAARQSRPFIGFDSNPFAIDITVAKFQALECFDWGWAQSLIEDVERHKLTRTNAEYCKEEGISNEVSKWFHEATLRELLGIHELINTNANELHLLKIVLFSAILKSACSQRKHYTYVTDGCFPRELIRVPAKALFAEQIKRAERASEMAHKFFEKAFSRRYRTPYNRVQVGDARNMSSVAAGEIGLIVTSPPYLGCNDYAKSMRLTQLFFPSQTLRSSAELEIGARWKRKRASAADAYLKDMRQSLNECKRVLRKGGYLALVFGQGTGKVRTSDVVKQVWDYVTDDLKFTKVFDTGRKIRFHRIRFPTVMNEKVAVFRSVS